MKPGIKRPTRSSNPLIAGALLILVGWAGRQTMYSSPAPDRQAFSATDTLLIGLILSAEGADAQVVSARRAATLAVEEANAAGGFHGSPFGLVIRVNRGPWGSGSTRIAELVFDHEVLAVVGSLDGRSAHVAEQIVTKGRVAFVSSWATESTVTQAYVPWVFRCVPDDRQQAQALVAEFSAIWEEASVLTVRDESYDARAAEEAFVAAVSARGHAYLTRIVDVAGDADVDSAIFDNPFEAAVLFVTPTRAVQLVGALARSRAVHVILGPLNLSGDALEKLVTWSEPVVAVVTSGHRASVLGAGFDRRFAERWGERPDARAAYAYDAVGVVLAAVGTSGRNKKGIRDALSNVDYDGVTGPIRFDARGNSVVKPAVVRLGPAESRR